MASLGWGSLAMTCGTKRNWKSKHLAKIARRLGDRISSIKTIPLPDMRNLMHNSGETEPSGSGAIRDSVTERELL
jgi:hypothetical protein